MGKASPVEVRISDETKTKNPRLAETLAALSKTDDGTWFTFRAVTPLPPDADIHVLIGPGVPSAEGPNPSTLPSDVRLPHVSRRSTVAEDVLRR